MRRQDAVKRGFYSYIRRDIGFPVNTQFTNSTRRTRNRHLMMFGSSKNFEVAQRLLINSSQILQFHEIPLRSPDSHFDKKDCGRPSRRATSA